LKSTRLSFAWLGWLTRTTKEGAIVTLAILAALAIGVLVYLNARRRSPHAGVSITAWRPDP